MNITTLDLINLVAAIASGVLAIVALALSIIFFVLAKRDADRSAANASQIAGSVERLEKLFDTLYSDTFSMMRETYTDMRKHVWTSSASADTSSSEAVEVAADTEEILGKVADVSKEVGVTGKKLEELQSRLQPLLTDALAREKDKSTADLAQEVLFHVRLRQKRGRATTLKDLARILKRDEPIVVRALFDLARAGEVVWPGSPKRLAMDAQIRMSDGQPLSDEQHDQDDE